MKTKEELRKLLTELLVLSKETEWMKFKEAKTSYDFEKLGKYFSALSNEANLKGKDYAWIVFGVNNQRKIVGSQYKNNRNELDNLKSGIATHTANGITFVEIYELYLLESRVVMFQIPTAPKGIPISWKGHYYGRNGEALCALNIQEIEQIRKQAQSSYDWSLKLCENATTDDLAPDARV